MINLDEKLLNDTENFLNRSLDNKSDLLLFLKVYSQRNSFSEFEDLCFTGKYLNGLFKVIEKSNELPEVKSVDHIKKEISENLKKIMETIKGISSNLTEEEEKKISIKYLQLTQNSLLNLKNLAEDFDDIKKYLNYLKSKS